MAQRRKPISEINVVPYIDVMLVLLVIFMATAPLLTQGVKVDLPQAPSKSIETNESDPLIVSMRKDGALFMNLGAQGVAQDTDDGTRVTVFSLEEQAGKILRSRTNVPVYIKADHALDYGAVVRVMTVLQRAGAESVGLITDPPIIES
ncbi:MAG: biopolymer transport protein TolR [Candidatus Azotimanducaceae bacterium]|jgi:biopolymer transport protein TolR|tara:strand:- start:104 stop:547 length:444 start_codon:yes stop_codon:yes gene_type:complete